MTKMCCFTSWNCNCELYKRICNCELHFFAHANYIQTQISRLSCAPNIGLDRALLQLQTCKFQLQCTIVSNYFLWLHFRCLEYANWLNLYFKNFYLENRFSNIMTHTMINHNHHSLINSIERQRYLHKTTHTCHLPFANGGVGRDDWQSILSMVFMKRRNRNNFRVQGHLKCEQTRVIHDGTESDLLKTTRGASLGRKSGAPRHRSMSARASECEPGEQHKRCGVK